MRRAAMKTVVAAPRAALVTGASSSGALRSVYSIWGTVAHESHNPLAPNNQLSLTQRITTEIGQQSHQVKSIPVREYSFEKTLTEPEEYLLSALDDDIARVMACDWTFEFDSFWGDRLYSHQAMFDSLYNDKARFMSKWLFGNASGNAEAKALAQTKLNYLGSAIKWANETEKVYTGINQQRFMMQREVFDAFEREKILAGCVEAVNGLKDRVPYEFKRKSVADVEFHLNNMRHWVWDAPNAKQTFKRELA